MPDAIDLPSQMQRWPPTHRNRQQRLQDRPLVVTEITTNHGPGNPDGVTEIPKQALVAVMEDLPEITES
jgi:hypothetical protein